MASPFKSVQCSIGYDNTRLLSWNFEPKCTFPADSILKVENSRTGGPWEVLATLDPCAVCSYSDARRRNYGKVMDEVYRLRLQVMDGSEVKEEYVSETVDAGSQDIWPFSSEARNAVRQIETAIRLSGCTGILLKRKTWGNRCPKCTDFDGQMSVNEHCPSCFGTGIKGGYYNGISLNLVKDSIKSKEGMDRQGYGAHQTVSARCVAYPFITEGDVWVEDGTNARYRIVDAEDASSYKNSTLVYRMTLNRIEYTDALYAFPIDDKVALKDVWDSSAVNYTPQYLSDKEAQSSTDWNSALEEL